MLTFLELYQTLLGFVFFKLFTDVGLVYPPPLDLKKLEAAAGIGAFNLQESGRSSSNDLAPKHKIVEIDGHKISEKDVRKTIKAIAITSEDAESTDALPSLITNVTHEEDFVLYPSRKTSAADAPLPTLRTLETLPRSNATILFTPYTFFLSRETSRSIFEFLIRSFGGKVGWPASSGDGSPIKEDDPSITHVIIDRPIASSKIETQEEKERRSVRKYVQPQWIVDCINSGRILLEDSYAQGQTLPPHLSPFDEYEGAYDPTADPIGFHVETEGEEAEEDEKEKEETSERAEVETKNHHLEKALQNAAHDPSALRTAELVAEAAGMDYDAFANEVNKFEKKGKKKGQKPGGEGEDDMNKMMMSNKKRKLYEKMKHSQKRKESEVIQKKNLTNIYSEADEVFIFCFIRDLSLKQRKRRFWPGEGRRVGKPSHSSVIATVTVFWEQKTSITTFCHLYFTKDTLCTEAYPVQTVKQ